MKNSTPHHISNRVLKINVGFLLSDGPGISHNSRLEIPSPLQIADDVMVDYLSGPLRLSRTKEGILVQSELHAGVRGHCSRCLEPVAQDVEIIVEELYGHLHPHSTEFRVQADGILDLGPLLREEVLLETSLQMLCRPDCRGLCPECGANLNLAPCDCGLEDIDPRLAKLKELLKSSEK